MTNTPRWPFDKIIKEIEDEYSSSGIINDWKGEKESINNAIEQISINLPPNQYNYKCTLGVGGSGIVCISSAVLAV